MIQIKLLPPADYLRACFIYNPEKPDLYWRERPRNAFASNRAHSTWNARYAGKPAGMIFTSRDGHIHRVIMLRSFSDTHYRAHRIVWKMMTSEEPPEIIDHIDGDALNNRWANLRAATPLESTRNRGRQASSTGIRGVFRSPGSKGWWAKIGINGSYRYLGTFTTPEEASAAYETAAREAFGTFYRDTHAMPPAP